MDVILLEKIHNLGALGDKVKVKPGYGRNYLIPNGKAVPATEGNVAKFEARRAELEKAAAEVLTAAQTRADKLKELKLSLARKAGEEGKLYGSVGTADIAEAAEAAGHELGKHEIHLPDGPIRVIGEYLIDITLHADVDCSISLEIVAEQ
ncbi:MAG: 50S ribosomal protein L9 [Gammaproteobacteria bacterium]